MKEALLWEKSENQKVNCRLCNHRCNIAESFFGICGVRQNIKGILYSTNYGRLIATNIDPIEKKPLFHFLPGSESMSIASAGCNFHCEFCQNYSISQIKREGILSKGEEIKPDDLVKTAKASGCRSISYTYTEPTVYFEYVLDCSKPAKREKIYNVWVTNGFLTKEGFDLIAPYIDAANIDLKAFNDETYKKVMGGRLQGVLDTITLMNKNKVWVEVTTLIVPGMNDSESELKETAKFLCDTDPDIPWHLSAYHADYKFADRGDRTSLKSLNRAQEIGYEVGLHYVYCGNVPGHNGENTYCYNCKELLIERHGFSIGKNKIVEGKCFKCKTPIPGVWI